MPHTKLVFVKLLLKLADDRRFIMELNDSQKLDFFLLLLMAGLTYNKIPDDIEWLKTRFKLQKNTDEISANIQKIKQVFKNLQKHNGCYKFKNFKQLHNYIYKEKENSLGILKEFYKDDQKKNTIDLFSIISILISFYIYIKDWKEDNIDMPERNRYGKRIKELLILAKGNQELVKEAIQWVASKNYIDWTLETVIKKWPDFMKYHSKPELVKEYGGKDDKRHIAG